MKLFHITTEKNLQNILQNGLIPFRGLGLARKEHQKYFEKTFGYVVFLTDNVEAIATKQDGDAWIRENKAVVIELDVDEKLVKQKTSNHTGEPTLCANEFLHTGSISQTCIVSRYFLSHR